MLISHLGLSPRVRGNRLRRLEGHPRSGGTQCLVDGGQLVYGLSPRVRGNLERSLDGWVLGSIPAAGEPHMNEVRLTSAEVYPRVCGGSLSVCDAFPPGLSPRMRGNPTRNDNTGGRVYPRVCGGTILGIYHAVGGLCAGEPLSDLGVCQCGSIVLREIGCQYARGPSSDGTCGQVTG